MPKCSWCENEVKEYAVAELCRTCSEADLQLADTERAVGLKNIVSQPNNGWISVAESLPETRIVDVDIWVRNDKQNKEWRITNAHYEYEGYFKKDRLTYYCEPIEGITNTYVKYWQIPKPPLS